MTDTYFLNARKCRKCEKTINTATCPYCKYVDKMFINFYNRRKKGGIKNENL